MASASIAMFQTCHDKDTETIVSLIEETKRNRERIRDLEADVFHLKAENKELSARIHELEPCHRCSTPKSGSYGQYCEECHFTRLDRDCQELGLSKWADSTDEMLLNAYESRCKAVPQYKTLYRECYERATRRSEPY